VYLGGEQYKIYVGALNPHYLWLTVAGGGKTHGASLSETHTFGGENRGLSEASIHGYWGKENHTPREKGTRKEGF